MWLLALSVGCAGGIYEVGGSLRAPILLAAGFSVNEVTPATLAATFLSSIAGIGTYEVLQLSHGGTIAPDWALGGGSARVASPAATSAPASKVGFRKRQSAGWRD